MAIDEDNTLFYSDWEIERTAEQVTVSGNGTFEIYSFSGDEPAFEAQAKPADGYWYSPGDNASPNFLFRIYIEAGKIYAVTSAAADIRLYVWEDKVLH